MRLPRTRWKYALAAAAVVGVGVFCREIRGSLDGLARDAIERAAEGLWAVLYFLLVAIVRPRWPTPSVAAVSLAIVVAIEFSQLIQTDWMNALRGYPLGRLMLGTTFLWADLFSLVAATLLAAVVEAIIRPHR